MYSLHGVMQSVQSLRGESANSLCPASEPVPDYPELVAEADAEEMPCSGPEFAETR